MNNVVACTMRARVGLVLFLACSCLVLTALVGPLPGRAASLAQPASAPCDPAWLPVPGLDLQTADINIQAVAASDPHNVWAVGSGGSPEQTRVLHWDGHALSLVPSPNINPPDQQIQNSLTSVAVVSPIDIWAVGKRGTIIPHPAGGGMVGPDQALAEHWDGQTWQIVPLPDLATDPVSSLKAVATGPGGAVWAVGQGNGAPLLVRWDGAAWRPLSLPAALRAPSMILWNLAVTAPNDIWVLGSQFGPPSPVLGHWDGAQWTTMPLTATQFGLSATHPSLLLQGISATGPADVWVAGTFESTGEAPNRQAPPPLLAQQSVLIHWDGQTWSRVPSPNPGQTGAALYAVAAIAHDDAWAVGSYITGDGQPSLVLHWNGSAWSQAPGPNLDPNNHILSSLAVTGPGEIWAAGWPHLLAHYGRPCSPTPPPTARVPDPHQPGVLYFPLVGHTLRGSFRTYWEQHGGLLQFGYPLTEEYADAAGPTAHAPLSMQYFERARFEHHPENGPPYDVLLGLLGREVTAGRMGEAPFLPHPAQANPGTFYFAATQHNLPPTFAGYWRDHGGLPVYGYPISEAFTEVSPTDGRPYLVQYFERNRFEFHPELPEPFRVSLGLLGVDILRARGWLP